MAVRTLSCVQRASEEEAPAYERQHRTTSPESTPDASGPLRSGPQWSLRWDTLQWARISASYDGFLPGFIESPPPPC